MNSHRDGFGRTLGTVVNVRGSVYYFACRECHKKFEAKSLRQSDGRVVRCEGCGNLVTVANGEWRYRLCLSVTDGRGSGDVVLFGETADALFGCTASKLHAVLCGRSPFDADLVHAFPLARAARVLRDAVSDALLGREFAFRFADNSQAERNYFGSATHGPGVGIGAHDEGSRVAEVRVCAAAQAQRGRRLGAGRPRAAVSAPKSERERERVCVSISAVDGEHGMRTIADRLRDAGLEWHDRSNSQAPNVIPVPLFDGDAHAQLPVERTNDVDMSVSEDIVRMLAIMNSSQSVSAAANSSPSASESVQSIDGNDTSAHSATSATECGAVSASTALPASSSPLRDSETSLDAAPVSAHTESPAHVVQTNRGARRPASSPLTPLWAAVGGMPYPRRRTLLCGDASVCTLGNDTQSSRAWGDTTAYVGERLTDVLCILDDSHATCESAPMTTESSGADGGSPMAASGHAMSFGDEVCAMGCAMACEDPLTQAPDDGLSSPDSPYERERAAAREREDGADVSGFGAVDDLAAMLDDSALLRYECAAEQTGGQTENASDHVTGAQVPDVRLSFPWGGTSREQPAYSALQPHDACAVDSPDLFGPRQWPTDKENRPPPSGRTADNSTKRTTPPTPCEDDADGANYGPQSVPLFSAWRTNKARRVAMPGEESLLTTRKLGIHSLGDETPSPLDSERADRRIAPWTQRLARLSLAPSPTDEGCARVVGGPMELGASPSERVPISRARQGARARTSASVQLRLCDVFDAEST